MEPFCAHENVLANRIINLALTCANVEGGGEDCENNFLPIHIPEADELASAMVWHPKWMHI